MCSGLRKYHKNLCKCQNIEQARFDLFFKG
jgi:hypothetical protein